MVLDKINALDWKPAVTPRGSSKDQAPLGVTTQATPSEQWLSKISTPFPRHIHSPCTHSRSPTAWDINAVMGNSKYIHSPLAERHGPLNNTREQERPANPYTLALELLKHLDRQRSGAADA
jgi:hypothetical protein